MAEEEGEEGEGGKLPCVDHGPLNEGAVGKMTERNTSPTAFNSLFLFN